MELDAIKFITSAFSSIDPAKDAELSRRGELTVLTSGSPALRVRNDSGEPVAITLDTVMSDELFWFSEGTFGDFSRIGDTLSAPDSRSTIILCSL